MFEPRTRLPAAALAALLALWLGGQYILPLALPFLLGFLLALGAEPVVGLLDRRLRLSRGPAAFLGVTVTLALLSVLTALLISLLIRQLGRAAEVLPDLEKMAREGLTSLEDWLLRLAMSAPDGISALLTRGVLSLFDGGSDLYDQAIAQLPALATGFLSHVPDSFLTLGTGLLSAYLFSARMPRLHQWFRQTLPAEWRERWVPALRHLKSAVIGWLRAQAKLMAITFSLLCIGLLLLRISFAPIWALLIALVDAVPMLGTGLILIPWSLICFLQGSSARGLGMLGLFAAATLIRSTLEPRLLGRQLGLDPLVTLAAMYAGYQLFGLPGLLVSPILAVAAAQFLPAVQQNEKL